ncbi:hypothetical protein KVT40_002489 [Elsinoe batatas]|uniref:AN1-type zinc finger protein n=1 Tax=Elsinoe batatas TaxID=2601811 RepID=A0A8K0L2S5_9PEZI|nr:hypothetical protein KVT40_002489 [Elsinoe batatas]
MRSNSVTSLPMLSPVSSRSSSVEPEPTMQIFVKNVAGATFALSVPESTTISTLSSLLALRTNLPATDLRLVHAGKHLSQHNSTLSDYSIASESTIHLAFPLRGGAPKKIKCNFKDCKDRAQPIVGDCGFCSGHYCGKHRMLESHACAGLENCKEEEKRRNRERLEKERTVAIKGI